MRAIPLAFIERSNVGRYYVINTDVTHPNDNGRKASLLTILTAWHFLREDGSAADLIDFLLGQTNDDAVKELLTKIDNLPSQDKLSEEDYVFLHGVQPLPYISWDKNVYRFPAQR